MSKLTHSVRLNRLPVPSFNAPKRHLGPVPPFALIAPRNLFQTGQSRPRRFSQRGKTKDRWDSTIRWLRFFYERDQLRDRWCSFLAQNREPHKRRAVLAPAILNNPPCNAVGMQKSGQFFAHLEK